MHENLKARITGKLQLLTDEQGRQVLDYIEFLASKFNRSQRAPSPLQRLAENIEDALGTASLSDAAAKGTARAVNAASRVMAGLAAAGKAVADELSGEPGATPAAAKLQGNGAPDSPPAPEGDRHDERPLDRPEAPG